MLIALSVLPIVLTICCGYLLVATRVLPKDQWDGIETLSFRLLIPVVLIRSIAVSELSVAKFGGLIGTLVLALVIAGVVVLAIRAMVGKSALPNPAFTTVFQTTTRWNAFIALAAAELFIGSEGLGLIAVAMAVLIPLINIANIVVLATYGTAKATAKSITMAVVKNPLVQACLIGLTLNLSGATLPEPALQTLDLIGRAALGVGLLAVGAGVSPARLLKTGLPLGLGVVLRLFVCPALFLGLASFAGLDATQTLAGVLILAVPAASNGYIIARQMGGDADLYADILTWQTVLAMALLPALAVLLSA